MYQLFLADDIKVVMQGSLPLKAFMTRPKKSAEKETASDIAVKAITCNESQFHLFYQLRNAFNQPVETRNLVTMFRPEKRAKCKLSLMFVSTSDWFK